MLCAVGGASIHPSHENRRLPKRRDSNGTHIGIRRDLSWKSTDNDGVVAPVTCRPAKDLRRFTGGLRRVSRVRPPNRKRGPSRYRAQTRVLRVLGLIEDGSVDRVQTMIQSTIAARHRPQKSTIGGHFPQTLTAWALTIRVALERHRQRRALAELDDRLLDDIGITRSRAMNEANKPLWSVGKP